MARKSEVLELLKADLAELEAQEIIAKQGAWYRLLRPKDLPTHVGQRITEIAHDSKGVKVKLSKSSKFEKIAVKVAKLT